MRARLSLLTAASVIAVFALAGASKPSVLSQISSGLWEIPLPRGAETPSPRGAETPLPRGAPAIRLCVAEPPLLAQVEHRSAKCTRTVLRDDSASAVINYSCDGGGFGHSKLTMLTPRSVRIETQGIADYAPFAYVVHARRVGNC